MATNNSINTSYPIESAAGGSGVASPTAHGILVAEGSSPFATKVLTNGQLLIGSTGADPVAASITSTGSTITVTAGAGTINIDVTAPLNVAHGGTGATTLTANGVLIGNGASAITASTLTNGQLLIGNTGNAPSTATITAGTGISVTNGAGSITIASSAVAGGGWVWVDQTTASVTMAAGRAYSSDSGSLVTFTLPAVAAFGDSFLVTGSGAGGWTVAQQAGQTIQFGTTPTTTGVGGSLSSTQRFDCVQLTCIVANSVFIAYNSHGNLTVV